MCDCLVGAPHLVYVYVHVAHHLRQTVHGLRHLLAVAKRVPKFKGQTKPQVRARNEPSLHQFLRGPPPLTVRRGKKKYPPLPRLSLHRARGQNPTCCITLHYFTQTIHVPFILNYKTKYNLHGKVFIPKEFFQKYQQYFLADKSTDNKIFISLNW